jgi:predicted DCC family thiol-disulfide oxidoreductase YuxK
MGSWASSAPEGRVIAVYDRGCGACLAFSTWIERRDRRGRIDFQDGRDAAVLNRLGIDRDLAAQTLVVVDPAAGKRYLRAAGLGRLLCEMGPWSVLGWLLRAPPLRPLADRVYRAFAQRRRLLSRWAGLEGCTCSQPGPEPSAAGPDVKSRCSHEHPWHGRRQV